MTTRRLRTLRLGFVRQVFSLAFNGTVRSPSGSSIESAAIARRARERKLEMDAVGSLANVALMRSDYPRAADLMSEVDPLGRELGDENAVAVTRADRRASSGLEMAGFNLALHTRRGSLALQPQDQRFDERRERGLERCSRCARVRQAETCEETRSWRDSNVPAPYATAHFSSTLSSSLRR